MAKIIKTCKHPGCNDPTNGKSGRGALGYCGRHYQRLRNHGSPEGGRTEEGAPLAWLTKNANYDGDECLKWPFGAGRGNVMFRGRQEVPARVMCTISHGDPPSPKHHAAHNCGLGSDGCINPKHLRWATPSENHMDKVAHGTMMRGQGHPSAKLTQEQAIWIKQNPEGLTMSEMARRLGVAFMTVSAIAKGRNWSHL